MTSPYDPEAIAFAMAGGVVGTLAALREENARLRAEVERLREASQRCMEISTGLAAAGIVGHANILDVLGAALRGGGR